MVGVDKQAKEYKTLSDQMGKILLGLTKVNTENPPITVQPQTD